jgi:hypothetical protein
VGLGEGNTPRIGRWNIMNTSQDGCSSTTTSSYFKGYSTFNNETKTRLGSSTYHEESKDKESCDDIWIKTTKIMNNNLALKKV